MDKLKVGMSFETKDALDIFLKDVENTCGMRFVKAHTGGKHPVFGSLTLTLRCENYGKPKPRGTGVKVY